MKKVNTQTTESIEEALQILGVMPDYEDINQSDFAQELFDNSAAEYSCEWIGKVYAFAAENGSFYIVWMDNESPEIAISEYSEMGSDTAVDAIKIELATHDTGDDTVEEYLAGYDLRPNLATVNDDYGWEVKVWVEYNYYAGSLNAPTDHWATSQNDVIVFDSYASAQEWINDLESAQICLGSGEAGRPSYIICEA